MKGSISELVLWSQFDNDNDNGSSNSVLIIINANELQVHNHLARGDVNAAKIASDDVKKYARLAVVIGIILLVITFVFRLRSALFR